VLKITNCKETDFVSFLESNNCSKKERQKIEFVADVIVKVTAEHPLRRKDLKVRYILQCRTVDSYKILSNLVN